MKTITFLTKMFRNTFNNDIIYKISQNFTRNMTMFYYKKKKLIKYRIKNFKERKKICYHLYYH